MAKVFAVDIVRSPQAASVAPCARSRLGPAGGCDHRPPGFSSPATALAIAVSWCEASREDASCGEAITRGDAPRAGDANRRATALAIAVTWADASRGEAVA
jgi:hypothetical protein